MFRLLEQRKEQHAQDENQIHLLPQQTDLSQQSQIPNEACVEIFLS